MQVFSVTDGAPQFNLMGALPPPHQSKGTGNFRVPLCDQAAVELEANTWAALWQEEAPYAEHAWPAQREPLAPIVPWAIR